MYVRIHLHAVFMQKMSISCMTEWKFSYGLCIFVYIVQGHLLRVNHEELCASQHFSKILNHFEIFHENAEFRGGNDNFYLPRSLHRERGSRLEHDFCRGYDFLLHAVPRRGDFRPLLDCQPFPSRANRWRGSVCGRVWRTARRGCGRIGAIN